MHEPVPRSAKHFFTPWVPHTEKTEVAKLNNQVGTKEGSNKTFFNPFFFFSFKTKDLQKEKRKTDSTISNWYFRMEPGGCFPGSNGYVRWTMSSRKHMIDGTSHLQCQKPLENKIEFGVHKSKKCR